jgi:hypothetical protein
MTSHTFAFLELKRRLTNLEVQHNTLTSICAVLAKQIRNLKAGNIEHKQTTRDTDRVDKLFQDKQNVREINIKKKSRRVKTPVSESESEPEPVKPKRSRKKAPPPSPSESESEPEDEPEPVKPKRTTKGSKKGAKKGTKKAAKKTTKADKSMAIEIVDSMN